ncbi:GNAT family N-acetyltransferase [Chromobacterium sp. S0633]|uniref:GNAT family N-acetyltransferase n=1 Tax=Chromobacterium sp. S0633 TaxID=2957805 RepID=UPI00209E7A20|nr:GNAT family N-acetyltransferase [Chromobacterium sp. S0633]MCP1290988.1 GNAT family N-acetyltransferase [Chromobacterium sp. S0633]
MRPAVRGDLAFLLALRRASMGPHLQTAGRPWDEDALLSRVHDGFEHASIILEGERDIGLLKVARRLPAWRLIQLQLLPDCHGRGLGGKLIRSLQREAEHAGAALELSVLERNPARRLYLRLGFVDIQYADGEFLMRWTA